MLFIVFYPLPIPEISPNRFVSEIPAILKYLCIRSSDVVSKLALGQFVLMLKPRNSSGHQIFANPELSSKRKDAQRYLESGTPNIIPRVFSGPVSCRKQLWRTTG